MHQNMMPDDSDPCERRVMIAVSLNADMEVHQLDQHIPLQPGESIAWIRPVAIFDPMGNAASEYTIFHRANSERGSTYDVIFRMVQSAVVSTGNQTGRVVVTGGMVNYQMSLMVGIRKPYEN